MQISLRKVTPDDLKVLQHMGVKTFVDTYAAKNKPENLKQYLDQSFNLNTLLRELLEPNSFFFFACKQEVPIGYLKLNLDEAQTEPGHEQGLEIERIYVLRHFQGNGVGRKFLQKADELAYRHKKRYVWLGVWQRNPNAIAFYQRMGFNIFSSHEFMIGSEIQTDWMMRRRVDCRE